jgi:hypothetical protein
MPADLKVVHSTDRDDEWSVALDGRYVVGFFGRGAREMAERHMNELAEMLALREHAMAKGDGLAEANDNLKTPAGASSDEMRSSDEQAADAATAGRT